MPTASVAIPVLNDRHGLMTVLDALDGQTMRADLEVIVVDNGSSDGSYELGRERAEVADQITGGRGSSRARNRALELASAAYLLTLDSDTWPVHEDWAERLMSVLARSPADVLATAGPLVPAPSRDRFARRVDITPQVRLADGSPPYAVNGSACYKTSLLRGIGGYPDVGANDAGVGRRARVNGLRYLWVSEATAYHRNEPGLQAYVAQMRKIGQYVAEQEPPPERWARWFASQARHAGARCRPIVHGNLAEAAIGVTAVLAQTRGAYVTWRSAERLSLRPGD
jgi:glycosyltransferase involved in cell wall biosynthesis